jgi:heme exporter protein B
VSSTAAQVFVLARKGLVIEYRVGEALLVIAPFGAVALFIIPLAIGVDVPLLRQVGPNMYWIIVLLFGVLTALRKSSVEGPAQTAMLRLAGVPILARLLGDALASTVLLVGFELLLIPVAVVLYDPQPTGWMWLVPVLAAVAFGLALLGALSHVLLDSVGVRMTLGALVSVPLAIPLLLGATQTFEAARAGASPLPWLALIVLVDLVILLCVVFAARMFEETS